MNVSKNILAAGALAFALGVIASCEVGPNYSRPQMDIPYAYKSPAAQTNPSVHLGDNWWLLFNDYTLTLLENSARTHNPDLQAAFARVQQARASAADVRSAFFPLITLDPSFQRTRTSANRVKGGSSTTSNDIQIPFDLSYELDIWGRVRRSYEAAVAQKRAQTADYYVVLQTLEADVAQDYYLLRSLELQDDIFTRNIALYDDQLRLSRVKLEAGILGNIDIVQIQTLRDSAVTQQLDVRRQRDDTAHALAILTGRPPQDFHIDKTSLLPAPPVIPAGLPADILRQRPDVGEAEQNLIVASANVGVATANFYPRVTLTGSMGQESFNVQRLFDWESMIWSFGPNVTIPIFTGGKLTADLRLAEARYRELDATFRSVVLTAFRDTEVSLTDIHSYNDSVAAQEQAVKSSREYLHYAQIELGQGIFSQLQVLDADRTLLTNEITLAQLQADRLTATVALVKALGGGWDPDAVTTMPATTTPAGVPAGNPSAPPAQ